MNAAARLLNQGELSRGWVMTVFLSRFHFTSSLLVMLTLLSALSLIYVTNSARTLNAHVQQSIDEKDRLQLQWNQLLLEKSSMLMQSRIENIAEERLSMVFPDSKVVVMVNE
jgi:cell division protein FtsL